MPAWRVEDLCADVERALDDTTARIMSLEFDATYGFPREYGIADGDPYAGIRGRCPRVCHLRVESFDPTPPYGIASEDRAARATPASPGVVVGSVRDWIGGETVAGARVILEPVRVEPTPAPVTVLADEAGRFLLRVPAGGAYELLAHSMRIGGSGTTRVPMHVRGGDTVHVDVFVPPDGFDAARRRLQLDELAERRERWQEHRPEAYRAAISWECFCFTGDVGEWTLEVRPDTTVVLRRPPEGGSEPPYPSVDSVFAWLASELRDPYRRVEVRYHPTLGYPTDIRTDALGLMHDAWTHVRIRGLRRIRAPE